MVPISGLLAVNGASTSHAISLTDRKELPVVWNALQGLHAPILESEI